MSDCLFCKIVAGEIPSNKVYEDEQCLAFRDINPQAKVHILVIPKEHIPAFSAINEENASLAAHILVVAAKVAKQEGLESYRIVSNCGPDAGQTVEHLHFHILGGEKLSERMV